MKILELVETLAPGGGERFVVDLSNELAKSHDVHLAILRKKPNSEFYRRELNAKIIITSINGKTTLLSKFWQIFQVIKMIMVVKPTVVHAHLVAFNYIVIPSILFPSIEFFYTVHNVAEKDTGSGLMYHLKRWIFRSTIKPITISTQCEKSFTSFFGYNSYQMIDNGCRNINLSETWSDVKTEIDRYKPSADSKVFLNVARLMEQKNHELLIHSFKLLLQRGHDAILLIIGDYENNPTIKSRLDEIATSERIIFLGTKQNVTDYLASSDYFCLSSKWEGLPISLLEAGLSGVYPISTPVGGVPDVIIDPNWGMLSADIDVSSYLNCLEFVMTNKFERHKIAELYESKFLITKCAKKYENTFLKARGSNVT